MDTITLTHQGRPVALAGRRRVWFAAHIEALPPGHPRKRFICFMALFARDVLTGTLAGPYTDSRAERFARLALINPETLAANPDATDDELAQLLGLPTEQIAAHRLERRPRTPVGHRRRPAHQRGRRS